MNTHSLQTLTELPTRLSYALRFPSESRVRFNDTIEGPYIYNWLTNLLFELVGTTGPREPDDNFGGRPFYMQEGFLPIQNAIAQSFITLCCNQNSNCKYGASPDVQMQRFPYPPHTTDFLLQSLELFVSFSILLSFMYTCVNTVRFVTIEKEKQLKGLMIMMGVPNWVLWTSWFLRTMICMTISITIIIGLLKVILI